MRTVYVGTSGWVYKDWHEAFYPPDVPKRRLLAYYATQFPTVEINSSFYRLLSEKAVADWVQDVPASFRFVAKGSRFITHMKKLRNLDGATERYFDRLHGFGPQLGPILWQLPPQLTKDVARLADFLAQLPAGYRYAVEFRHPSWLGDDTYELLSRHRVALVWLSSNAMPEDCTVTTDFVFLRFHGLRDGARHDYTTAELKPWAARLSAQARKRRKAYVYFNNDLNARAPKNAQALEELIGRYCVLPEANGPSRA